MNDSVTNESLIGTKQGFQRKLEAELKEWDARVDALKAKARGADADIRAQFEVQLESLAGTRALAEEKLEEVRRHGVWAWEDLKGDVEKALSELRAVIERSASLFNQQETRTRSAKIPHAARGSKP